MGADIDALPRRGSDQPRTYFGIVFKFGKMLDQSKANGLKYVRAIRFCETKPDWNGIDEPPISEDERLPGLRFTFQAQRHQFRIAEIFILHRAH